MGAADAYLAACGEFPELYGAVGPMVVAQGHLGGRLGPGGCLYLLLHLRVLFCGVLFSGHSSLLQGRLRRSLSSFWLGGLSQHILGGLLPGFFSRFAPAGLSR